MKTHGSGSELSDLTVRDQEGKNLTLRLNPNQLAALRDNPGQRVRVTAGGFKTGSTVTLLFLTAAGDAIEVARTKAGQDGRIDTRPNIPTTAPEGASQMTALGIDSGGAEFVRAWLLTVVCDDGDDDDCDED